MALALGLAIGAAAMAGSAAAGTVSFAPVESYPTGSSRGPGPGAVTTAALDVDGDGDIDVVTTDLLGGGPIVVPNLGDATFGPPARIAGAGDVGALGAGDLDGDGRVDLVGRDGSGVIPLLANGDGTFEPGAPIAVSGNAQQSVAVVDVDADGVADIVTTQRLGIQVLLGRGDGTFDVGPVSPLSGLLADVRAADLEGDGAVDLLVADATPRLQRVVALRGSGDGTFVESGSGAVGAGPEGVLAGDLDGDGRDDAVSVDSFSVFDDPPTFSITALLGDGAGGFRSSATYPTGDGPVSGALGDFDADGNLDVAVSAVSSSEVTVYRGDGTGALEEVARPAVVRQPQTPVVADLDGDGRSDIAAPGVGALSVLRNTSAPTASGASPSAGPTTSTPGASSASVPGTAGPDDELPATGAATPLWLAGAAVCAGVVLHGVARGRRTTR